MNSVLIIASGGLDSTALIHLYKSLKYDVHLMYFNYGQKNLVEERGCLVKTMKALGIPKENLVTVDISIPWNTSNITTDGNSESEEQYVEMRNLIFASYAISYCEAMKIEKVAMGFTGGCVEYPDTSDSFQNDLYNLAIRANGVQMEFPLANMKKVEVANLGLNLGMEIKNTFSCNVPVDGKRCGKCPDCLDIKSIIKELKVVDSDNPFLQSPL